MTSIRSDAKDGFKSVEKTGKAMVQIMLSKLQVMDRSVFKKTALLAVGAVLLYYSVAWTVLRCPHFDSPHAQEVAAYEAESAHRHANLDCTGPKYHTEFLAGPSSASELLRFTRYASHGTVFPGIPDLCLSRFESDSGITLSKVSPAYLPFDLPRYLSLSVFRL